jgi:ribulose-phosphate 3-epimerase
VGLALNPLTSFSAVQPFLDQVDLLVIMTVNPGFGGQEFIRETFPKIQHAEACRREKRLSYRIGVDGGITSLSAVECARAGADTFIAGTSLFGPGSMKSRVTEMRKVINQ